MTTKPSLRALLVAALSLTACAQESAPGASAAAEAPAPPPAAQAAAAPVPPPSAAPVTASLTPAPAPEPAKHLEAPRAKRDEAAAPPPLAKAATKEAKKAPPRSSAGGVVRPRDNADTFHDGALGGLSGDAASVTGTGIAAEPAPRADNLADPVAGGTGAGYGAGRVARPAKPIAKPVGPVPPPVAPPPPPIVTPPLLLPPVEEATPSYADANAYYENTYQGGSGARDHIEELISKGLVIDGKSIPMDALAADYRQPFPLPVGQALALSLGTEHRAVETSGGRTTLQIGIQGIKNEIKERPPLRISLVIDRSGSMKKEERLEKVREAALKLSDQLVPGDEIAIIAFDDKADVLCEMGPASRPEVKAAIRKLATGGGTNIFDGLELGYQQLTAHPAAKESFQVVFLFSDGEVTAGEQDPLKFDELTRAAFASKIATTTFGVGLSFNESLMMGLSQSGKGNYHFLRDASASEKAIQKELDDYTHVVATNVHVRVKLADGVKLVRVFGAQALGEQQTKATKADEELLDDRAREELGIAEDRSRDDESGIKMLIPQFYGGDTHVILMEVEVPAGSGSRPVAEAFLKYKDMVFARNGEESETVAVRDAADKAAKVRSLDSSVKKNILGFETGEALVEVASLIRAGRAADAAKRLDEQRGLLSTAASLWVDDDLRRDAELMLQYKDVVASLSRQAAPDSQEALAKALAFSGFQRTF